MERIILCSDCGFEIDTQEKSYQINSEVLCQECFDEKYFVCSDCHEIESRADEYITADGRSICERCSNDYFTCTHCNGLFPVSEHGFSEDWDIICQDCFENYYSVCEECGHLVYRDDVYYSEDTEQALCYECFKDIELKSIRDYNYKPVPNFKTFQDHKKGDSLFYGLELEVENSENKISNESMASNINDENLYCKHDGSLEDGFEIVSHPFSWSWYKENKKYFNDLLDNLKEQGFESFTPGTCGIHIHMSKKAFTTLHLFKFLKIFYEDKNFETIRKISQRTSHSSSGGCQWGKSAENQSIKDQLEKAKKKRWFGRYTAINLENNDTVEVRIFRGTLNKESFHKNFEFLQSLYDYTSKESTSKVSIQGYLEYVFNNRKEFINLYQFLVKKNITGKE
jgi:hypothetical protein